MDEQSIGKTIRSLRQDLKITLTDAARKAGIAKGTLSKIENGQVSAPISTLLCISQALGVPISQFFREQEEDPPYVLVRSGAGIPITRDGTRFGYSYEALAPGMSGKTAEPFLLTIRPEDPPGTFCHGGQEFIFMVEGSMEFTIDQEKIMLHAGDSLYFDPSRTHKTRAAGPVPARFICLFIQDPDIRRNNP